MACKTTPTVDGNGSFGGNGDGHANGHADGSNSISSNSSSDTEGSLLIVDDDSIKRGNAKDGGVALAASDVMRNVGHTPPIMASIGSVLIDVFDAIPAPKSLSDPSHLQQDSASADLKHSVKANTIPKSKFERTASSPNPLAATKAAAMGRGRSHLTPQQSFDSLPRYVGETYEQIGGGALYALVGARMWLPPSRLRTMVDRALPDLKGKAKAIEDDLSPEAEKLLKSFGKEIWAWNRSEGTKMTRSRIRYDNDISYQSIVKPPHRTMAQISASPLRGAEYLHISPPFSAEDVSTLLDEINARHMNMSTNGVGVDSGDAEAPWRPKIVFEPAPFSCHPGQKEWLEKILPGLEVLSPNHEELFSFYSIPAMSNRSPEFCSTVERLIRHLVDEVGIGLDGRGLVVVRCGRLGACVGTKGKPVRWCPAFFGADQQARVKDVTGAGNAFLGGFIAGLSLTNDGYEALLYGTVSSSFVCEQKGLPTLIASPISGGNEQDERWNDDRPLDRLEQLRRRVDNASC